MSNPDQDTELTMCDVLEEEQELEEDAEAVLGGSDDTNCSYEKGYVPRQALYTCMTCVTDAGVCLACCYACHDGHEVVELYTKRNFRCDCGNSKFGDKKCSLKQEKEPLNTMNKYNQNFRGLYCSCSRPYPDPDDSIPDEMIQCIVCEDWFHGRHLKTPVPDEYFEMICFKCMASHKFLYSYQKKFEICVDDVPATEKCPQVLASNGTLALNEVASFNGNGESVKVDDSTKPLEQVSSSQTADSGTSRAVPKTEVNDEVVNSTMAENQPSEQKNKTIIPSVCSAVKAEATSSGNTEVNRSSTSCSSNGIAGDFSQSCILKAIDADKDDPSGSTFWPENWRQELCRCQPCMEMYTEIGCSFLLNPDDTIKAYEDRGKGSGLSSYESGLSALGQLDRVKQMEAVRAYTNMKGALKEYLREFAENKKTVCESDIKEFFEKMGKKRKLNNGVPHFCR